MPPISSPTGRWRGRPAAGFALRAVAFVVPIALALGCSYAIVHAFGHSHTFARFALVIASSFAISTLVLALASRALRRLLPLAALLQLSLAFPGEAPSRFKMARGMTTRALEEKVRFAREHGIDTEPVRAAEQIIYLAAAEQRHDPGTRGHSERVRVYSDLIGEEIGLEADARDRLRWAALLHDVGKLSVPPDVLNKVEPLESHEIELIHRHPAEGARIAQPLASWLGEWAGAIYEHHERWDGAGYPTGLAGESISRGGRILAVADSYETMTAWRSYRRPTTVAAAREELVRCSGGQFDPSMVRAFLSVSVRKLGWTSRFVAWLGQIPLLRAAPQAILAPTLAAAAVFGGAIASAVPTTRAQTSHATTQVADASTTTETSGPKVEVLGKQFARPTPNVSGRPGRRAACDARHLARAHKHIPAACKPRAHTPSNSHASSSSSSASSTHARGRSHSRGAHGRAKSSHWRSNAHKN